MSGSPTPAPCPAHPPCNCRSHPGAFALHCAQSDGIHRYDKALSTLHRHVTDLAHRRVRTAHARIDRGTAPPFAEYDLLHGLTGIGAYLLRSDPGSNALEAVLTYLVRLTQPLLVYGRTVPGWWCAHDPHVHQSPTFPAGHANFGIAHGISVI